MRLIPLGSGSQGNATLVEIGGKRILVDAGLPARTLARRLESLGVEPSSLDAILLSHEHHDHARGAERFSRAHGVPVACALETLEALDRSPAHFAAWQPLEAGARLHLGGVTVEPFPVPHDAVRTVGFVLEAGALRAGIVTDLGHATTLVVERLRGCQLLMVEANHDDVMLRDGPYPWALKQRVGSRLGHLSNDAAARLLERAADDGCLHVVLAHLSERNNTPRLAREAVSRGLRRAGLGHLPLHVAASRCPGPVLSL